MHVVIFEGSRWDSFAPLSLSRPTFMLPCGMGRLIDQQLALLQPSRLTFWIRPEMAELVRQHVVPKLKIPVAINEPLDDEPALLTTGRTLHFAKFEMPLEPCVAMGEDKLVQYAFVKNLAGLSPLDVFQRSPRWISVLELPQTMPQGRYVRHIWDLIAWNEEALIADFIRWNGGSEPGEGSFHLLNREDIRLMPSSRIGPGAVLDASRGPIVLDVGVGIGANAVIEGPCYIGPYTVISALSHIRSGTTIGKVCKIGGEVNNSIISSYSNSPHQGFIGDSFIGSWVNIGAGSATSNAKNTYGNVRVQIGSRSFDTGRSRLGSLIGDHSKLAIGTRLNTGSYVGFSCQLSGSELTPKFVPSYSFWTDAGLDKYDLERAVLVAQRMIDRRDKRWTEVHQHIFSYVAAAAPAVEQ